MAADQLAVAAGVWHSQRRSVALWALALAAVSAMYISFYPAMSGPDLQSLVDNLPDGLVTALGYDRIGTAGGYLTSTVYGLLGPALMLVFAIGAGARLIAGQEEDGTLELELTAPVSRRRVVAQRLLALWVDVAVLAAVVTIVTLLLVALLDMPVGVEQVAAGGAGLLLLVLGFGTIAFATGAVTGRRSTALGVGAGLAVGAFVLDAIGPTVDAGWMTAVSPFSWYLGSEPLVDGFSQWSMLRLAAVPVVAGIVGLVAFDRRDLMV